VKVLEIVLYGMDFGWQEIQVLRISEKPPVIELSCCIDDIELWKIRHYFVLKSSRME
jgi:hypothetical protein